MQLIYRVCRISILSLLLASVFLLTGCNSDSFPEEPQQWKYARDYPKTAWEKSYPLCERGGFQSPIDIKSNDVDKVDMLPLNITLLNHADWLVNNSYAAEVIFKQKENTLSLNHKKYILQEFHFHTPSENTIDGRRYPMELHWVYYADGQWLVVGVLFEAGSENKSLAQILKHLPKVQGKVDMSSMTIDFNQLLPKNLSAYYQFEGSLTTLPCSRDIAWYLLKQPITASRSQINQLRKRFGNNARPIQPLNQRHVTFNTHSMQM